MLNDERITADVRDEIPQNAIDVDVSSISSPALARIVEEVRNEEASTSRSYDRTHNRHNR